MVDSVPWVATAGRSCLCSPISMPSMLANSPTESRQRGEGRRLPGPKMAATEGSPPLLRQTKGALHPPCGLSVLMVCWCLWPSLWLAYSWMRVFHTCGPHRRPCFQECFLWKDTCFAGLQSRWPKPLGSRLSSPEAGPASAACGPGAAPAHNSPVIAPTGHLLQCRPRALQNARLIKTIMGIHTGLFFPGGGCGVDLSSLTQILCFERGKPCKPREKGRKFTRTTKLPEHTEL